MEAIKRFEGPEGKKKLIEALQQQRIINGRKDVAETISEKGILVHCKPGDVIIQQNDWEDDLYFILIGRFLIVWDGRKIATRTDGEHVGEICLIDHGAQRTATFIAETESVVLKISSTDFCDLAQTDPFLWREISRVLTKRLRERSSFIRKVNEQPYLFIGSSFESQSIAIKVREGIEKKPNIRCRCWWTPTSPITSLYQLEFLKNEVESVDFAAFIFAADDKTISRGRARRSTRDNVIFELGMFMGVLGRERVFIIIPEEIDHVYRRCDPWHFVKSSWNRVRGCQSDKYKIDIKMPSDLFGLNTIRYNPNLENCLKPVCDEIEQIIKNNGAR